VIGTDARARFRVPTRRVLRGAIGVAALLGLVELFGRTGLIDPALIPLPSTVLAHTGGLVVNGEFLADVGATLAAWAYGTAITIVIAVPLGLVLGTLPWVEAAVRPVVEFLRPIPSIALIPLALLIFHNDLTTKVAIVVYASMWPVLINTIYGLHDVDPLAKQTLRSFGFGPLAVLRRVSLPSAAPFIVTGVRLAASIALVVTIAAELLTGGVDGIGVFLIQAESGGGDTALLLAAIVWAGVLGFAANTLLEQAERRAFPWHHALTRGGT
jgi:NitT/TauT family transport system permease protein